MTRPDVTMADVALHAGVGIGTVSRVLNGNMHVSDDTRARVMSAADELGYRRLRSRPRRTFASRSVGVVIPYFGSPSSLDRLRGLVSRLTPHQCYVTIYPVDSPEHARSTLADLARSDRLDALVLMSLPIIDQEAERLAGAKFPVVLLDGAHPLLQSVAMDDLGGGRMATQHMISLGHRRIAFIGEPPHNAFRFTSSLERERGYRSTLEAAGVAVDPALIRYGAFLSTSARHLAVDLWRLPDPPTAIVAASDIQASGCVEAAAELGLAVPNDVSVVGYDDVEIARLLKLTTIRQPLVHSGERGADHILEMLGTTDRRPSMEMLPVELVVRSTTAAAPGSTPAPRPKRRAS